jgi:hypothetical protein
LTKKPPNTNQTTRAKQSTSATLRAKQPSIRTLHDMSSNQSCQTLSEELDQNGRIQILTDNKAQIPDALIKEMPPQEIPIAKPIYDLKAKFL